MCSYTCACCGCCCCKPTSKCPYFTALVLLVVAVICAIVAMSIFNSLFEDSAYLADLLSSLELLGTKTTSGGGQTMAGLILVFIVIVVILISIALCNLGRVTYARAEMNMNVPGVTLGEHAGFARVSSILHTYPSRTGPFS